MPLNDTEIKAICSDGFITPFSDELINPASIDIRLGNRILIEQPSKRQMDELSLADHGYSEQHPFRLLPGQFILAPSLERFNFPSSVAGQFLLKSSLMREGLNASLAGWCDPGWHDSVLTIGLKNWLQWHPVLLWPGRKIGQLVLHSVNSPELSYADVGRYNNSCSVAESKD